MKAVVLILPLLILAGSGPASAADFIDLTGDPGHLPYEARPYPHFGGPYLENQGFGAPFVLFDIDGDGFLDRIHSTSSYVCGVGRSQGSSVTYFQTNLDPAYCRESNSSFSFSRPMDLDGDGMAEVVVTGHTEDHWGWRFWVLDPSSGAIEGQFDLEGIREVRRDNRWDGNYIVEGMLEIPGDGGTRTALVICVNIGFDIEGRGVLAVDPWTGEILWRFTMGPNPLGYAFEVVDLEGDGLREVVVFGRAPDNLGGRKINGFSDDESRLFVLDHDGDLLWTRRLGGWFGAGFLLTADLTGDGFREVVTSTFTTPEVWGELVVWSHDGEALTRLTAVDQFQDVALIPPEEGGPPLLAVTSNKGFIKVLAFDANELSLVADINVGAAGFVNCVADILPPAGPELVFSSQAGTTWVLDREFAPLARFEEERRGWREKMTPWSPGPGVDLLLRGGGRSYPVLFAQAPPPPLPAALFAAAGALGFLFLVGYLLQKKIASRHRGDPAILREVRLNLLADLELSNHGAIAPLKCLRRLVWHLNAISSGLGDNQSIEVRLRETWTECVENVLPHLESILNRARLAGLATANIECAGHALDRIGARLGRLRRKEFDVSVFAPLTAELSTDITRTDEALQDLRREIAGFFHTDLATTVTRVLRANAQAIEEGGIAVQSGSLALAAAGGGGDVIRESNPAVTCLIDPKELDFVLDNLVANAVRAMEDSPRRNLSITWSRTDGMVAVDVRDTGAGIPDEHRGRIMETNFSTRKGGGRGLPNSRKVLRKYGGGLMVLDTSAGHGTTMRLTLPAAG